MAVITGPWIECHGWDQAAAQLLFLSQLAGGAASTAPFGYTCRAPHCGALGNATRWSCDASYREAIVRRFGPRGAAHFQRGADNSSRDLNATEFFVLRESGSLPRLQCMDCRDPGVVEVRGMNFPTFANAVSGWFANHKGMVLLHERFRSAEQGEPRPQGYRPLVVPPLQLMDGSFGLPGNAQSWSSSSVGQEGGVLR